VRAGPGGLSPQPRLMVMRPPIGPEEPIPFWLARGQLVGDLHLVEARAAGHGVLVGQDVARGPEAPPKAEVPEAPREREAAPIREGREGDGDRLGPDDARQACGSVSGARCRAVSPVPA
jgi:hypothetical protein